MAPSMAINGEATANRLLSVKADCLESQTMAFPLMASMLKTIDGVKKSHTQTLKNLHSLPYPRFADKF
jgi:hypothetical protein